MPSKNENFKNDFLDQSFGIGLEKRQNMFFTKYNASRRNTSFLCFFMFFRANISQVKLDKVSFLFNMTSQIPLALFTKF